MDSYSYFGFTSGVDVDTQTTWISHYGLDDFILPLDKKDLSTELSSSAWTRFAETDYWGTAGKDDEITTSFRMWLIN